VCQHCHQGLHATAEPPLRITNRQLPETHQGLGVAPSHPQEWKAEFHTRLGLQQRDSQAPEAAATPAEVSCSSVDYHLVHRCPWQLHAKAVAKAPRLRAGAHPCNSMELACRANSERSHRAVRNTTTWTPGDPLESAASQGSPWDRTMISRWSKSAQLRGRQVFACSRRESRAGRMRRLCKHGFLLP